MTRHCVTTHRLSFTFYPWYFTVVSQLQWLKQCMIDQWAEEKKKIKLNILFGVGKSQKGRRRKWTQVSTIYGSYSKHLAVWPILLSFRKWWQQTIVQFVKFYRSFSVVMIYCNIFFFLLQVFRRNSHFYTCLLYKLLVGLFVQNTMWLTGRLRPICFVSIPWIGRKICSNYSINSTA